MEMAANPHHEISLASLAGSGAQLEFLPFEGAVLAGEAAVGQTEGEADEARDDAGDDDDPLLAGRRQIGRASCRERV